ncbi:hypothetical protein ACPCTO_00280 [Streptomyces olivoreticuli]|uniref:hypothetical protein n=1 Tax=Streptomyces sp. UNOC14_S4 TaxID=2872340 RepID=UPI0027E28661|nr:hypothetical protein [Streptomyces sp. UNOC14_S4]
MCGTGGMKYLDQSPFRAAGISVLVFRAIAATSTSYRAWSTRRDNLPPGAM